MSQEGEKLKNLLYEEMQRHFDSGYSLNRRWDELSDAERAWEVANTTGSKFGIWKAMEDPDNALSMHDRETFIMEMEDRGFTSMEEYKRALLEVRDYLIGVLPEVDADVFFSSTYNLQP